MEAVLASNKNELMSDSNNAIVPTLPQKIEEVSPPPHDDMLQLINFVIDKVNQNPRIFNEEGPFRLTKGDETIVAKNSLYSASQVDYETIFQKIPNYANFDFSALLKTMIHQFIHERQGTVVELQRTNLPQLVGKILDSPNTRMTKEALDIAFPDIQNLILPTKNSQPEISSSSSDPVVKFHIPDSER